MAAPITWHSLTRGADPVKEAAVTAALFQSAGKDVGAGINSIINIGQAATKHLLIYNVKNLKRN